MSESTEHSHGLLWVMVIIALLYSCDGHQSKIDALKHRVQDLESQLKGG